jgi:glutamate N-acetyltransferase/amino-acid N-acetyltransferase
VLLNSGNANACTGEHGARVARASATAVAGLLGTRSSQVLVASTGVIGVPLPAERLLAAVPGLVRRLAATPAAARRAARAIMTTDTTPKEHAVRVRAGTRSYVVGGVAKGAGMIHPDMATLLAVVTTDAPLGRAQAHRLLRAAVDRSFNALTVDGDTSTNDCVLLLANGRAGGEVRPGSAAEAAVARALGAVCDNLAEAVAADGEGARKLLRVRVAGARSDLEARRVARTVAASMLVKTAVHGGDPNWGRVLAAAGRSGAKLDPRALDLRIGGHLVARRGAAHPAGERAAARHLRGRRIEMDLRIGRGPGAALALGSDLSADYVRINAHYRT